jgi:exosortase/archaeosortase family protein
LGFGVRYALIAGLLFGLYAFPFDLFGFRQDWLSWYLAGYARMAGALLGVFESGVSVTGTYINGRFPLQIVRTCDAAEVTILFSSAVLAFPGPGRTKLLVLLGGVACLVVANLTRICSLYFVGVHRPGWFKAAHEEVWPLLLVAFAVLLFLRSLRFLEPAAEAEKA